MEEIALVEDDADNRLLMPTILPDLDDPAGCRPGLQAMDEFLAIAHDLTPLAVSLPEMNGQAVLEWLRERESPRERARDRSHGHRHCRGSGEVPERGVRRIRIDADRRRTRARGSHRASLPGSTGIRLLLPSRSESEIERP